MPKKECCCGLNICEWCNHDDPNQINWKPVTGTLTTEVPSIGHPLVNSSISNVVYFDGFEQKSYLRTPAPEISKWNRTEWGPGNAYGDIQPCWFNGINMKNPTEDSPFHKFKYVLRVKKKRIIDNNIEYIDIVNISWNGNGKNIRPHPDACGSFNVKVPLFLSVENGCGVFGQVDEFGNSPCFFDFAKMPRGPWPYRLKRNLVPDGNNQNCFFTDENGDKVIFPNKDEADDYNKTVPPNLRCTFIETSCRFPQPNQSQFFQCCQASTDKFCSGSEFCNALDDEGTPYGWEDCPVQCAGFSIYNKTENLAGNRRFFCWWNPHNRYTTPEWDVKDTTTQNTRKLSIHVIVPTVKSGVNFCEITNADQGFGEWAFGMDLEAPTEIATLEQNGFIFSNGREKQGVWIQKTPTNALRVLFTLDHADIEPGKVWRVFNDWNVKTDEIEWDQNVGSNNEFIVQVEQVLEELAFSSLGCDCPSGGITQGPQACEYETIDFEYENCLGKPKISFAERGPLAIRFYADTERTGAIGNCDDPHPVPTDPTAPKVSTETCPGHGTIMIVDAGINPDRTLISSYPNFTTDAFGSPYLTKYGDIPGPKAALGFGIDLHRYRNLYTPVQFVESPNFLDLGGNKELYGTVNCSELGSLSTEGPVCEPYTIEEIYDYGPIKLTPISTFSYIDSCDIPFRFCELDICPDGFRTPKDKICTPNLVKENNRPSVGDPDEQCAFSVCRASGTVKPLCDEGLRLFGIDSDNIYFRANASETTVAYIGELECYHSAIKPFCSFDDNCRCNFSTVEFYADGGPAYGGGFPDTVIKWRKYYCQKYASQRENAERDISKLPVDMMGKLSIQCDLENSEACNPNLDFCPCAHFWKYTCEINSIFQFPDLYNFGIWKVYTEKYNDLISDPKFGYYNTNYLTNAGVDQDDRRSGNVLTITQHKVIN